MEKTSTSSQTKTTLHDRCFNQHDLIQAVRDLGEALRSTEQRSQKWPAWQQLRMTNDQGVESVKPYTPEVIAILEASYTLDESDCDVIHHLAIAYHAMAWDLELCESNMASEAWKKALFYWRKLQACGAFWQDLCIKGESLGTEFNRNEVEAFRQNLMQYLLEIHVDFIRHYYEQKKPDQASRHIELIRQARISPAARKELTALVYEAMASTVPNIAEEGRFGDALTILDDFLNLFPSYLPALQQYLEIAKRWVNQMSPASQWQEILDLDKRVSPRWDALSASKHLSDHPLAPAELGNLASVLGGKHWARARSLQLQREEASQQPQVLECEEYQAYGQTIFWLAKVDSYTPNNPEAQFNLLNALLSRAQFVAYVGLNSDDFDEVYQLLEKALSDCQAAMKIAPGETTPRKLAANILNSRASYIVNNLTSFDTARLERAEKDLAQALQFDPEDPVLQENLNKIREMLGT